MAKRHGDIRKKTNNKKITTTTKHDKTEKNKQTKIITNGWLSLPYERLIHITIFVNHVRETSMSNTRDLLALNCANFASFKKIWIAKILKYNINKHSYTMVSNLSRVKDDKNVGECSMHWWQKAKQPSESQKRKQNNTCPYPKSESRKEIWNEPIRKLV